MRAVPTPADLEYSPNLDLRLYLVYSVTKVNVAAREATEKH